MPKFAWDASESAAIRDEFAEVGMRLRTSFLRPQRNNPDLYFIPAILNLTVLVLYRKSSLT